MLVRWSTRVTRALKVWMAVLEQVGPVRLEAVGVEPDERGFDARWRAGEDVSGDAR